MSEVALVIAVARNKVIGYNNEMPWHLSAELQYFKQITLNKPVIMGRVTYESITSKLNKPLPQRTNIIVTRNPAYQPPYADTNVKVVTSLQQAMTCARRQPNNEIMVIGGAQLYSQALPYVTKIYRTLIELEPVGDAFFAFDETGWKLQESTNKSEGDINYSFQVLVKI